MATFFELTAVASLSIYQKRIEKALQINYKLKLLLNSSSVKSLDY